MADQDKADIVYGGGAGGGKTHKAIVDSLRSNNAAVLLPGSMLRRMAVTADYQDKQQVLNVLNEIQAFFTEK